MARRINYISNLDINLQQGGWDGANFRIFHELKKYAECFRADGINPPTSFVERNVSRVLRRVGLRSDFFFFSQRRLNHIAKEVAKRVDHADADLDFYWGATPWIAYTPKRKYAVYLDASFPTYLRIYLDAKKFTSRAIDRISTQEEKFIRQASWVFWGSNWAMKEACAQYSLTDDSSKNCIINTGGHLPVPAHVPPPPSGPPRLLFISLNFEKKGGHVAVEVLEKVREVFPDATLRIIGQRPPEPVLAKEGIDYIGLLNKQNPEELKIFLEILSTSAFLIHPTRMDTIGAVIIEAGFYGCPSVAPDAFGIPDLIRHGDTGFLVKEVKATDIAHQVCQALSDKDGYEQLRQRCFHFFSKELTWEAIGRKVINFMT